MLGEAIAARALGEAGRRILATEWFGPRPAAVRADAATGEPRDGRTVTATKP